MVIHHLLDGMILQVEPYKHLHSPKFNMEAESKSLEKEISFGRHHYQVPCEKFPGTKMTIVLIGIWAFFWRFEDVVSPQNRGQTLRIPAGKIGEH